VLAPSNTISVVIADDHRMVRESLLRILEEEAIHVLEDVSSGAEALRAIEQHSPQIAIVDVSMPAPDGIEIVEHVERKGWSTRVLILTMFKEPQLVRRAIKAGAAGVVSKDDAVDDLCYAIRTAAEGRTYLSPSLANGMSMSAPSCELSTRELAVLRRVVAGETSKEIAAGLGLSTKTVETYRSRAASKLGVRSGPELVREALRQGLVSASPE